MTEFIKCLYCTQEKENTEFSLEHIFPGSLGGAKFSELFKTRDVCARCNSISGLFIDGPFIRNFFSQNDKAQAALRFLDLKKPAPLPMRFTGVLKNIEMEDNKVCEFWFGPHGGLVYHARNKADKRWDCMIGGNPIENKKNNGSVYIYAQNGDEYWLAVLLLSCLQTFDGARLISGNIGLPPVPEGEKPYFDTPNEKELKILEQIRRLQGVIHNGNLAVQVGFEQRFIAKLALGLGVNLFGNKFLESSYSTSLRNAMWEKDLKKRQGYGVQFYKYFTEENSLADIFAIDGAHTILLYPQEEKLFLMAFIYGRKMLMIPLAIEKTIWESHTREGFLYVVAPQVDKFIGPISVSEYVAYKGGIHKIAAMDDLMTMTFNVSTLPKITY